MYHWGKGGDRIEQIVQDDSQDPPNAGSSSKLFACISEDLGLESQGNAEG